MMIVNRVRSIHKVKFKSAKISVQTKHCLISRFLCVSVCLSVVAFGGVGCFDDGSVYFCLVGLGAVLSLCVVFCVFVMFLAVSVCLSIGAFGGVLSLCVWGYATIRVGKTDSLPHLCFLFLTSSMHEC